MIIDLTFIHQRPQAIAFFWSVGSFISLVCLALVPQFVKIGNSWRSFYLVWVIPGIVALVLAFFFYEETYFVRPAVAFDGRVLVQTATEKVRIYDDWDEVPGGKALPDVPDDSQWKAISRKLKFWGTVRRGGWRKMMACYPQILLCMCNPLIFWVALLNAIVFGGMLSIGMTYVAILSAPPYNLDINIIALVNLAGGFGALLGWPATGILTSKVSRRLAMRNGGVRDAEHYLPAYILPVLAGAASVILYGLTAQLKWHFIFVYISYFLNTFTTISMGVANTLWVTEAFPRWAAGGIVVVGGGSYIASFGMSYLILPWVKSQGYAKENIQIGVMILVIGGLLIPVALWGKSFRHYINRRWAPYEVGALRPQ
jgi:MFS family permease